MRHTHTHTFWGEIVLSEGAENGKLKLSDFYENGTDFLSRFESQLKKARTEPVKVEWIELMLLGCAEEEMFRFVV